MLQKIIGVVAAFFLLSENANAEGIQAQCGSEEGQAFAIAQGIVRHDQAGWYSDRMTGETVIRIDTNTGEVDLRFKDATGTWQTVSDQGGSAALFAAHSDPATFMMIVTYPGATIETLVLADIHETSATLIHTSSRAMTVLANARVMTATCRVTPY